MKGKMMRGRRMMDEDEEEEHGMKREDAKTRRKRKVNMAFLKKMAGRPRGKCEDA